MVFSVSPSVSIREVDLTTTIPAISNSPAAIAGVFNWGPVGERILVSSESDLVNRFGEPSNNNPETFFTAADFLSYSTALYVVRVEQNSESAEALNSPIIAKYPGSLGNSLEVSYVTSASGFSSTVIALGAGVDALTFGSTSIVINTVTELDLIFTPGDVIRIGSNAIGYQNIPLVSIVRGAVGGGGVITFTLNLGTRYSLSATNISQVSIQRLWKYSYSFSSAPTTGNVHIIVADRDGKISKNPGTILEKYENVSMTSTAKLPDGTTNFWPNVLTNRSRWVKQKDASTITVGENFKYFPLTGGLDGETEDTISFGAVALGYDLYKESDEVDISFVLQGKAQDGQNANLANYILSNIVDFRKDCMLFVSPRKADVVDVVNSQTKTDNVIAFRNTLQNSSYWFMDSGYKYRYDKYNDEYRWIPLNGDIAGLSARILPWESPAGYKRGVIKNVIKLAYSPSKAQRDLLYGNCVNPVMSQVGQGFLLFGDKTGLNLASAFDRINVRRLFITVEKAIATVSASFLFDFNDEFTQSQFKNLVEPFLRDIQGQRGIIDFRIVADATVNTPDVVDRNIFRGNIFIKPSRTINFIELTFVATRTSVDFDEIINQPL